jgi:tetratricopeptide (TPR) repeat protein
MRVWLSFFFVASILVAQVWRDWVLKGVRAFENAQYQEAAAAFQKAADLSPNEVMPHLYLANTYKAIYDPMSQSSESLAAAAHSEAEFDLVLRLEPNNTLALRSLADMLQEEAATVIDETDRNLKLDRSAAHYQRLLDIDSRDKKTYYSLGMLDWQRSFRAFMQARRELGMKPDQPGPLADVNLRQRLKAQYWSIVARGIANFQKTLEIDPAYNDAAEALALLIRQRADLRDTPDDWRRDEELARQLYRKPPEIESIPPQPSGYSGGPQRIRVGGNIQQSNLIRKVTASYPPLAQQARIQGIVKFTAIIGKDGHILNLTLVSGHPLLVDAAKDAVQQYEYRPTLLNGQPVEVVTIIDVAFTMPVP